MSAGLTIALDAMGGDHGPEVVVPGAEIALVRHPDLHFIFFGAEERIRPLVEVRPALATRAEIVHTDKGDVGWCLLPDGRRIEEWEFFRANAPQAK